jgi:Chaperone of endosialidase
MKINHLPKLFIILFFVFLQEKTFAQMGINATGTPPASNAMLDISSTTKGLLIPRMTTPQRTALAHTKGLTVFDITTDSYWYSNGAAWVNMATISSASPWLTSGNDISNSNTGNIGIGTASPFYKLDVLTSSSGLAARFKSSISYCSLNIDAFNGDAALLFFNNGDPKWNIRNRPSDESLEIYEQGGGGSRMVVQRATGNIGIGGVLPLTILHVKQPSNGLGLRLTNNAWDWDIYTSNGAGLNFNFNGVNKAYISSSNGSYVATSDARLKKDINKMPSVLVKVMELQAKTYKYLDNKESDMASSGFIAQEVMPLFPDLVSDFQRPSKDSSDTTVYHGLNYAGFSVVAIKAIQEQQQIIEKQQVEIDLLKKQVQSIIEQVSKK